MAISIREKYERAKKTLTGLKPSPMEPNNSYTVKQKEALGFAVRMLISLAQYEEQKFQDSALDVYKLIHPHREWMDQQMMLVALAEDDEEDVIKEVMHAFSRYHFIMLDAVEETHD